MWNLTRNVFQPADRIQDLLDHFSGPLVPLSYLSGAPRGFLKLLTGSVKSCLNVRGYHFGAERTHEVTRQTPHGILADRDRFSSFPLMRVSIPIIL